MTGTTANPGLSLDYDTATSALTVTANTISLTSPAFPGISATATDFVANNSSFSLGDATLQDSSSITLGGFLEVSGLEVAVSGLDYQPNPPSGQPVFGGTIGISTTSASLFPNQSLFSASVNGFQGSYDLNTSTLSLSATSASVTIGQILDAEVTGTTTAPGLSIKYDGTTSTFSVSANTITLTSPDFPGVTATASDLVANNSSFTLGNATLQYNSSITLGGLLEVDGLEVSVSDLDYQTNPPAGQSAFGGTIGISATSASLKGGSSAFTTSVTGFAGSYDLNSGNLSLSAATATLDVGSALDVSATNLAFSLNPFQFSGSATVSLPQFELPGTNGVLSGTINDLLITSDGFSVGSLTLSDTGTISYGSVFSIVNPSITFTNFAYSASKGASFNSVLTVSAQEIDLNKGGSASASATNLTASISFQSGDLGDFTFQAGTVNVQLGSYLAIQGSNISFDADPPQGGDIVSFGSLSATVTAGSVTISGTATDFAIAADGSFVAGSSFGVSLSTSTSSGDFQWPVWLPIQIQTLARAGRTSPAIRPISRSICRRRST